ncbi:MAG: GIDE domain-containing protein [Planctomycetota bacterium]|jgi:hypothetical protein
MESPELLIIGSVLLVASGVLGYLGHGRWKVLCLVRDTPTVKVNQLPSRGIAEIKGRVSDAGNLLESPMRGTPCVYYHFEVEEKRTRHTGKSSSTYWATVIEDEQYAPCAVEDETGEVMVSLREAELMLDADSHDRSGFLDDASPELEDTLQRRYGRSSQGWIFNKSMRYTETVLEAGDPVYVLGTVAQRSGMISLVKGDAPFIVSDKGERGVRSKLQMGSTGYWIGSAAALAGGGVCFVSHLM